MANRIQIQEALRLKYNRVLFAKEILSPIFGNGFSLHTSAVDVSQKPNQTEARVIQKVQVYGKIVLDDTTEVNCYEILLQPQVRIEQSKVAIQHYVRKMLTSGQAALINFVSPTYENTWRLTLVAKDSILTEKGVKDKTTHAKRFTFLLGPSETCKTAAERFEAISTEKQTSFDLLVKAFSVERLSTVFFNEYQKHYFSFVDYLNNSKFKTTAFKNDEKAIRDFSKKLLGRIVFLYFVQKKGWLGASNIEYTDGDTNFMMNLFTASGGNESFYSVWLTKLFFDTLNTKERKDDFELPDGKKVKIPYLNGGLFDKEEHDDNILVFKPTLFHNPENADDPAQRGFLDFLNSFNFTVFEDSPEEHTIAVDPEMLGHIFENLLEDNKDKGTFYTPKEIVHYMCQESLTEYLVTHLAKEYTLYKPLGDNQLELFGNEARTGQLSLLEELGDKALNREHVEYIVKFKDINGLSVQQLNRIDKLLDDVRICDPAIGSGAFPMGLLQEIFAIKEIIAYQLEIPWQPATVKENIIQKSIYGVDIEKGAVDIARLRFWLSLVVDEDKPKALPNLDYKIVVGDSLLNKFENEIIEIDWSNDTTSVGVFAQENRLKTIELLKTISSKQNTYFHVENSDKKKLAAEIRTLKIDLLINQIDQMVKTKGLEIQPTGNGKKIKEQTELYIQTQGWKKTINHLHNLKTNPKLSFNHFDWKLDFPEILNPFIRNNDLGFDIVIGNPPYGAVLIEKAILKKVFPLTSSGNIDSYKYFIDNSLKLTKISGVLNFITSDSFIEKEYFLDLRTLIINNAQQIHCVKLGDNVFESVNLPTAIISIIVNRNANAIVKTLDVSKIALIEDKIKDLTFDNLDNIEYKSDTQFRFIKKNTLINDINCEPLINLYDQVMGVKVYQVGKGKPKQTSFEIDNDVFISSKSVSSEWLKFIDSGVKKYYYEDSHKFIKYGQWLAEPRDIKYFKNPKVILREVVNPTPFACYIEELAVVKNTNAVMIQKNSDYHLLYLLAILNSKIFNYYIANESPKSSNKTFPSITSNLLKNFPIKLVSKTDQIVFIIISRYILFLKTNRVSEIMNKIVPVYFEHIIDGMVYELYFPELLKKHDREIIKHLGDLPDISKITDDTKILKIIQDVFDRLNDKDHPVRVNLFYMDSIPEIAIIEGKNPN